MADKQLSALTAATSIDEADLLLISQGGNSRKATASLLRALAGNNWRLLGTGQTSTGIYDQAVDGTKATVDFTGLVGASEIMVVCRNITLSVSGIPLLLASVDNGSTFPTSSGDYISLAATGVESNSTGLSLTSTAATAARTGVGIIQAANVSGIPKVMFAPVRESIPRIFVNSTNDVDAVRIVPGSGGNVTGGKIYCLVR